MAKREFNLEATQEQLEGIEAKIEKLELQKKVLQNAIQSHLKKIEKKKNSEAPANETTSTPD